MINYKKEYINALLAYVSYANMNGIEDNNILWANLKGLDLSTVINTTLFVDNFKQYLQNKNDTIIEFYPIENSLLFFRNNFKILDQKVERGFNGFSVTKYQLKNTIPGTDFVAGQVFLSFRGTEITWADGFTDVQLAFSHAGQTGPTTTLVNNLIN